MDVRSEVYLHRCVAFGNLADIAGALKKGVVLQPQKGPIW
jgi:hypothetical protein